MNKSINNLNKRAAVSYRGFFFSLILSLGVMFSFSQETTIRHYQRKCELQSIVTPGQEYQSSIFIITFPDSIYSGGTISISKLEINGLKMTAEFIFTNNQYSLAEYRMTKKRKEDFMKLLDSDNPNYSIEVIKIKRKYSVILRSKSEEL